MHKEDMDKELEDIRAKMSILTLRMQQEPQIQWRYEWPLRKRVKWHVHKLFSIMHEQQLRRWLW
jgi:hypothetical protein